MRQCPGIVDVGEWGAVTSDSSADEDWQTEVVLEIGQHPDLSDNRHRAIEMNYGMEEGGARISVRRARLFHVLKRPGPDTGPTARRPRNRQIVPLNALEILEMGR